MYIVNVSRSTSPASTAQELQEATVGDWPLRSTQTLGDITEFGDVIIGVRRNVIVSAFPVRKVTAANGDRFRVTPGPAGDWARLVGKNLPDDLKWSRGEGWPLKVVDTREVVDALEGGVAPEVSLGGYRLAVSDGKATVYAPRGASVTVVASP